MRNSFTPSRNTVIIDNSQPPDNESNQDPGQVPAAKTECLDTEGHSADEAARLALDEYFKEAGWNLVNSDNEDAVLIEGNTQQETALPPWSEQQGEASFGDAL